MYVAFNIENYNTLYITYISKTWTTNEQNLGASKREVESITNNISIKLQLSKNILDERSEPQLKMKLKYMACTDIYIKIYTFHPQGG